MNIAGSTTLVAAVPPKALFDTLTRIEGLASWNGSRTRVVDRPTGAATAVAVPE